jgi:hypothetical protein
MVHIREVRRFEPSRAHHADQDPAYGGVFGYIMIFGLHPVFFRNSSSRARRAIESVDCMPWDDPILTASMVESDALVTYTPRFDPFILQQAKKLQVMSCHSCPEVIL